MMPFTEDASMEQIPALLKMNVKEGDDFQKPLLQYQEETGAGVEKSLEGEGNEGTVIPQDSVKHVHFSRSLQRALEEKERDEEQGIAEEDMEEERAMNWEEYWEWVKAETKCYANYICPVVIVNVFVVTCIIVYFLR